MALVRLTKRLAHSAADRVFCEWTEWQATLAGRAAQRRERHLDEIVRRMNEALVEAKKRTSECIADEKRLASAHQQEIANAHEWERRVTMAQRAGHEALASEALDRKREHELQARPLEAAWRQQSAKVEMLKRYLRACHDVIEQSRRLRNIAVARDRAEAAERAIGRVRREVDRASESMACVLDVCSVPHDPDSAFM
jgi:phage shock protein A